VSQHEFAVSLISDPSGFTATTTSEGQSTVLALCGRVESHAAFELGALLDSAIDQHPDALILDLSKLEFMGASGMVAISNAEKRLADMGRELTIRSPSVLVNRLLEMKETAESARPEHGRAGHGHLGAEDLHPEKASPSHSETPALSADLRQITAMPAHPDVIDGALGLVVELALSCIGGADGVSVSLLRHGVLSTVAASDETIMAMDADQYATGEGPCVDASMKGHWFHAESLDTETRWPSFTPQARGLGIKAILSSPLTAFSQPVGALNIYSRTAESFEVKDQESAARFARKASMILSDARVGVNDTEMANRFKEALYSREVIAMAKGVMMERYGFEEDAAFDAILRLSLYHGEPLRDLAHSVVLSARPPVFAPKALAHE
jgi:anti-anti-sigma factor